MKDKMISFCDEITEKLKEIDNYLKEDLVIKAHDKLIETVKQFEDYKEVLRKLLPEEEVPKLNIRGLISIGSSFGKTPYGKLSLRPISVQPSKKFTTWAEQMRTGGAR